METPPTTDSNREKVGKAPVKPVSSATNEEDTMAQSLYSLIGQQPFFKGLNPHQLQLLTDSAMEMRFQPGQLIFEEGSPANRFYLVLAGKVVLESVIKERGVVLIETLGPGDDLGWSWLLPPYYLQLSARAVEPTRTIFFYGTRLREQCEQDHDLGYELMKRIAEVMGERLRAMQRLLMECTDTAKLSEA
jgi:CRP/FNR family transcriptional regulator, cyclic AMP receptor protein